MRDTPARADTSMMVGRTPARATADAASGSVARSTAPEAAVSPPVVRLPVIPAHAPASQPNMLATRL
ncbi:hypothetical protein GCM10023157_34110 [Gluconacetobacter asukensis]